MPALSHYNSSGALCIHCQWRFVNTGAALDIPHVAVVEGGGGLHSDVAGVTVVEAPVAIAADIADDSFAAVIIAAVIIAAVFFAVVAAHLAAVV